MFENLTYKQKFWALLAVLVLTGFTAYKRSYSLTLNSKSEYQQLAEKLNFVNQNSNSVSALDADIRFLDQLIGKEKLEPELVQLEMLNFVTNLNKNVQIESIEDIHQATTNGFLIHTNQLIIEGGFNELTEVVYAFEKKFTFSRVINISYFKKKDFTTKKIKLFAKITFQNYEKTK